MTSLPPSIRRRATTAQWAEWFLTNAAGAHTLRYGLTRPWVMARDVLFEDGSRALVSAWITGSHGIAALDRFLVGRCVGRL